MLLFHQWKRFRAPEFLIMIIAIGIIAVAGTFLTTRVGAGWDRASEHIVTVDVYSVFGNYCYTYGYSYYVADTTTAHYTTYHLGPDWATPDDHPYPHTGTLTERLEHQTDRDLDTLCDGSDPNDGYDSARSGSDS